MQLGFVIDQTRCIGCHACTVACKSENNVPVGDFRTWVKYVEQGEYPEVNRSFAVLRCNQCTDAPCVEICPVTALDKRSADGIVDIDPDACIGCKACMQACPYDALYINEDSGTAQKCHFCAHRTERGLAPACAVVCPTEAIIPGDFHDPESRVSQMRDEFQLSVRKPEAATRPNVYYREAAAPAIDPTCTNAGGGYLWAQSREGVQLDSQQFLQTVEDKATARTVYNADHPPLWGSAISGYLFAKSIAAGTFLVGALHMAPFGDGATDAMRAGVERMTSAALGAVPMTILAPLIALVALLVTTVFLVADLKRPDRFLSILLRPNWNSWLAKGSFILVGYGAALTLWFGLALFGVEVGGAWGWALAVPSAVLAAFSAIYTAWLFGQSKARVLWMKKGYAAQLFAQALVAGSGVLLVMHPISSGSASLTRTVMLFALLVQLLFIVFENRLAPVGREAEYERVTKLLHGDGPFARRVLVHVVLLGIVLPAVLLTTSFPGAWPLAGLLALYGLWNDEDVLVRAGQALPIS